MMPEIKGKIAYVFEEPNFDVDLIVGASNINVSDIEVLKDVCMKDFDEEFKEKVSLGDVIVGGENFGYGHPHFPSCRALRALGISAIVAESFAPDFYRAETTNGFPLIECPNIVSYVKRWDGIEMNWQSESLIINNSKEIKCSPLPKKTKELIKYGGIINYIKNQQS